MSKNQTVLAALATFILLVHPFSKQEDQPAPAQTQVQTETQTGTSSEEKWTVTHYGTRNSFKGSMFYTLSSDKGHLIFVDSGYETNTELLSNLIEQNGGRLDMWILTHPHKDHVNGFFFFYHQGYVDRYDIGKVIYQTYPEKLVSKAPEKDQITAAACDIVLEGIENKEEFHEGSEYTVGNLNIRFYNSWSDEFYDSIELNKYSFNSYSGAFMVSAGPDRKNRMFFAGDIKSNVADIIADKYGRELDAAYLQAPHHGQEGKCKSLLKAVRPDYVMIDRREDDPGDMTLELRKYLEKKGIPYEMHPFDSNSVDLF